MKKSELYHIAQDAVLDSGYSHEIKLEVLRQLMNDEDVARYVENKEDSPNGKPV